MYLLGRQDIASLFFIWQYFALYRQSIAAHIV